MRYRKNRVDSRRGRQHLNRSDNRVDRHSKQWRRKVLLRDNFTCKMPKCGATKKLQAHHIEKWSSNPAKRYIVSNGITLCDRCHKKIFNREAQYAQLFKCIVNKSSLIDLHRIRLRKKEGEDIIDDDEEISDNS